MVHPSVTGLVDNWQTIISPYGTAAPRSLTLDLHQTIDHNASPLTPTSSTTMISGASTPSPLGPSTLSPFGMPTSNPFSASTPSLFGIDDLSGSTTMVSYGSTLSTFSVRITLTTYHFHPLTDLPHLVRRPGLPTFTLPRITKGGKVFPGIKDLPMHIRQNFRNEFIRFVIKQVTNSQLPWANPDLDSLQFMYQLIYPTFPARLRHSDTVYHPVSDSFNA